jgi:hypothetical protein
VLRALAEPPEEVLWKRPRPPPSHRLADQAPPSYPPRGPGTHLERCRPAALKDPEGSDREHLHPGAARGARLVEVALDRRAKGRGSSCEHTRRGSRATPGAERMSSQATRAPGTGKGPSPRLISSPAATAATTVARRPRERLSTDRTGSTRGPLTPGPRGPPIRVRPHERATPHPRHNAPPPAAAVASSYFPTMTSSFQWSGYARVALSALSGALLTPAQMLVIERKRGFRSAAGSGGMQQPDRPRQVGLRFPRFRERSTDDRSSDAGVATLTPGSFSQ